MNIVGWFLLLVASCAAGAEQVGSVAGRVVDPEGAAIERASAVLAGPGVQFKAITIRSGEFNFPAVAPGIYTLTIEAQAWIDKTIPNIRVTSGESRDLKTIPLELAGCFAPGVMCDNFGLAPPIVHAEATVDVPFKCGVDADGGKMICEASDSAVDFRVRTGDNSEIFLTAAKGASVALDTLGQWSLSDCVNAAYSASEVRVDQLKHNSRACVHTNRGRYAEVYGFSRLDDGTGVKLTYETWPGKSDPH